jgi:two-component system CheB/CheR fusion protein
MPKEPEEDQPVLVAALGASAGGLEAIQEFLDHMPPDTGVAFLVVQHLDPSRESIGPELLGHHTEMPVSQAEDGDRLRPNHVHVTPPDAWISVESGRLRLEHRGDDGTPTVVDRLFRSLAEDQGGRAVAILLSGAGSDGAAGIGRVREAGGLTMVQDPATARFDSMPRHGISAGRVSDVLPPAELAARLAEYAERVGRAGGRSGLGKYEEPGAVFERVTDLLESETGRDFSRYKPPTILRRLGRRIQMRKCDGVEEYLQLLEDDADEVQALYEDALIGVTGFFRDPDTFRVVEEDVIPRILSGRDVGEEFRVWVAGCGTGQEAYSLAMLLHRATEDLARRSPTKIFATDVNEDALSVARRGSYPHGIAEEVPGPLLDRYFRHEQNTLQVVDEIREMCIFAPHDLLTDPPFSDLDLVSCRNLLIYLKSDEQDRLMPYFHYALRPGGFLLLGNSESAANHENLFREIEKGHRVYQRRETAGDVPMRHSTAGGQAFSGLEGPAQGKHVAPGARASEYVAAGYEGGYVDSLERILLAEFTPACVIVDERGEIVYYHGRTGEYLEPAPGRPRDDLVDMARPGLRHHVRSALAEAARADEPAEAVRRTGVVVDAAGGWTEIDLTVRRVDRDRDDDVFYLVVFEEPTARPAVDEEPLREAPSPEEPEEGDRDRIIRELEGELADTREQLQATIRELESANEELRVANEELITMNEELQSSNEELQTAQEETQSINEELQTVNAELSQKIEQLKEAHSDLENLFRSTEIATVFLDADFRFKRFTPAATELFRLRDSDVGRPLEDITSRIQGDGERLRREATRVLETLEPVDREIRVPPDEDGADEAWYSMRIFPYRTVDDVIDGVVLTFVDVTDIKKLELERGRLGAIVEGMHDAVVGHDPDGTITSWNEGAERLFGWAREEALGRDVHLIVPEEREGEFAFAVERVLQGEWSSPADTVRMTRDGEEIHVSVNFSPVRDGDGKVIEISQTARDITDRVEAERALRAAEERRNQFLTMLGHELRNPLGTIRTSVELLKQGEGLPEGAGDVDPVDVLDRQVDYLGDLVDDLSDMARMNTGEFDMRLEQVCLSALVAECVEDYRGAAAEAGVELEADVPEDSVVLTGDRTRLAQVAGNLIRNACSYTPEGGRVEVSLEEEDGEAVVAVADDGVGLTDEELERIFEMFERGGGSSSGSPDDGGLGLGLPVARRIVELHGGTLSATSDGPGEGATFSFRLPLSREDVVPAVDDRLADVPDAGGGSEDVPAARRVLVVEDNRDAARVMAQLLTSMGHDATVAHDARSGLDAARADRPDVVLCDINLPGEMDGYGLARAVRDESELDGVRLVALTGFGRDVDRERAREAGFDEHLTKPVGAEDLRRVLGG